MSKIEITYLDQDGKEHASSSECQDQALNIPLLNRIKRALGMTYTLYNEKTSLTVTDCHFNPKGVFREGI